MKNKLVIPILFLALVVVGGWGYSQYQARRQWEISSENQYQRAFEELTAHSNNLETNMSKALVAGSFTQSVRLLTNCWREANSSQEDLGQLPLASLDLAKTKLLLAKTGAFCFNAAQNKVIKGTDLTETEWKTLRSLRDQTRLVTRHLMNLRQKFYTSRTRWLEVDRLGTVGAVNVAGGLGDNKVAKAFLMLEDGLRRVPDVEFEGNNLDFVPKPTGLTGEKITPRQAVAKVRDFIGPEYRGVDVKYERTVTGGFPTYLIAVATPKNSTKDLRCSVSVKGGHLVWLLGSRDVAAAKLNMDQCEVKAKTFLNQNGFSNMRRVAREKYANIVTCTFVAERDQVLYYPELIKTQVAQDNGGIIGYDAVGYLTFHDPAAKVASNPTVSARRVKKLCSPHLQVESIRKAQVLDEMYNKVLCHEVTGKQGNDLFKIYYNAASGKEEKIRRVDRNGNEIQ